MSSPAIIALITAIVAVVGIFVTLGKIVYDAGGQSARVDSLEKSLDKFRDETMEDVKDIRKLLAQNVTDTNVMRVLLENINAAISARKVTQP